MGSNFWFLNVVVSLKQRVCKTSFWYAFPPKLQYKLSLRFSEYNIAFCTTMRHLSLSLLLGAMIWVATRKYYKVQKVYGVSFRQEKTPFVHLERICSQHYNADVHFLFFIWEHSTDVCPWGKSSLHSTTSNTFCIVWFVLQQTEVKPLLFQRCR